MEFQIIANGYSPEQVKQAIDVLSRQYRELHAQYVQQKTQYMECIEQLEQKIACLEQTDKWPSNIDTQAVGRALVAAEATAKHLVDNAKAEANSILREAKGDLNDLLLKRKRILTDTRQLFQSELDSLPLE